MLLRSQVRLLALGGLLSRCQAAAFSLPRNDTSCEKISHDVAVLGGGSSGTYTAIRLLDSGKSVVVIEARDQLGGHTETYTDPSTGERDDIGVVTFHDIPVVQDYFSRLDIPLGPINQSAGVVPIYFDFERGEVLKGYSFPDPSSGIQAYAAQLSKYPELIDGLDQLPDPVPEDLLLPFGEFAEKHGFEDAVPTLALYGQGGIDYINTPAVYILKYLAAIFLHSFETGSLTTARRNNHELYEAAYRALGSENVLLSSTVESSTRSETGVQLRVRSSDGKSCTDVSASKLVVSLAPMPDKMAALDPDATEAGLFERFTNTSYFTSVVRMESLPEGTSVFSVGTDTPFHLTKLPSPLSITPAPISGLIDVKYGSSTGGLSEDQVRSAIAGDLKALARALEVEEVEPEFVVLKAHTPFQPMVSTEDIAAGFYKNLWALQGYRGTFYTGAAWQAQDSSMLWNFTEHRVLPLILG